MDDVKRVVCLYRVSTKAQVDKLTNDIPLQKSACENFINSNPNWKLTNEYYEKGVSGYKKSALERDVVQQLKSDAEKGLFDVLLVFMFDRLGRRDDETPFILEWFDNQGIEVWSVKEGRQSFSDHTDKLINYIRFWQSGGESKKTGIRVKEKHTQMIGKGQFCGGVAPYGYKLEWSDLTNNKGRRLKKMVIDEDESKIVKLVYKLATVDGYGGHRIAMYLNERNIPTRKNSKWGLTVTNFMLRNPIYKGYPTYGKTSSQTGRNKRKSPNDWYISEVKIDELAIVDEEVWEKAQIIRKNRTPICFQTENINYANYPKQTKSSLLFTGFIRCGYCGSTLCTYTSVAKWTTKDGISKRVVKPSYRCTSVNRGIKCKGQITYAQPKIEEPVLEEIYQYLDGLEKIDMAAQINKIKERNLKNEEKELRAIRKKINEQEQEIYTLNNEVVKALMGQSNFTTNQLSNVINQKTSELNELQKTESQLAELLENKMQEIHKFVKLQGMIPCWKEEFQNTSTEIKKMLISELIEEVVVFRQSIEVKFKIDMSSFIN